MRNAMPRRLLIVATLSIVLCAYAPTVAPSADAETPDIRSGHPASKPILTLTDAIRVGLDRHPSLEQSRYASQAAKAITKQIQGDRYPWLEASVAGTSGSLRIVTTDGRT